MKQFLLTVAGVLVGLTLFVLVLPFFVLAIVAGASRPAVVPPRTVLALDLRGALTDQEPRSALPFLRGGGQSVMGVEETLRRAQSDARVKGLLVRLPEAGMSPAAADELAAAFRRFRAAGKPILAHSQGLYAQGMVVSTYELAAASGDIWMQPGASFQATGLSRQDVFFKRLFDRHQVVADFQQRYEYKNAVNPFLRDDYTPAHREAELSWMGSVYQSALASIGFDRRQAPRVVQAVLEAGPYSAEDAKAKGLIDGVGQVKEAEAELIAKAGDGAKLVEFGDYAGRTVAPRPAIGVGPVVAVISAEGAIMTGRGGAPSPLAARQAIRSDDVAKSFYRAIDDKAVRAIVFRVSSPGGSDTASEQILAAVREARAAGKPVVVSMGTYGASGGYWIASQASEIVAEPTTLTGSIGVFGGKFAVGPALAKYGIDMRGLSVGGGYADAFGIGAPMTAPQRAAFSAWMDRIYDGFVARVAQGRRLPAARVREIAKGRVWTGAQAKALGLVDEIGGFDLAVQRAKALAGIKGEARLVPYGVRVSPFAALGRLLGSGTDEARALSALSGLADDPRGAALIGAAMDARARADGATVLAPSLVQ